MVVFLVVSKRENVRNLFIVKEEHDVVGYYKILPFKTPAFRSFSLFLPVEPAEACYEKLITALLAYAPKLI
jgi:hypothetical protein